jgi:hypothetical protein
MDAKNEVKSRKGRGEVVDCQRACLAIDSSLKHHFVIWIVRLRTPLEMNFHALDHRRR